MQVAFAGVIRAHETHIVGLVFAFLPGSQYCGQYDTAEPHRIPYEHEQPIQTKVADIPLFWPFRRFSRNEKGIHTPASLNAYPFVVSSPRKPQNLACFCQATPLQGSSPHDCCLDCELLYVSCSTVGDDNKSFLILVQRLCCITIRSACTASSMWRHLTIITDRSTILHDQRL